MKHLLFLLSISPIFLLAQTQTIRGTVLDKDTQQPLIGATVEVSDLASPVGNVTDVDGSFVLENVPVGRHTITAQYLGYDTYSNEGVILNSAKELVLQIELTESVAALNEVVVKAFKGNEPLNELAVVSTRSFSVEETQRYAASANDPGRMAMGLPGVQASRDNRSDIVIRGNSSVGLLWRLNGIDIPNPNHFARRGSSGGGITIFSISMLDNSDFSTAAFPAEYGNAFSGVFDVKFRKGNMEEREYTFRAGLLGLDFSTEGPIKEGKSSYLVNYRYSTLGILNDLGFFLVGPRTDNNFQDLSFNLHFESDNRKSKIDFWGIGGKSEELFGTEEELNEESAFDDYLTRDFTTDMGAIGLAHTYLIDDKSYLKTTLAATAQRILYRNDTINVESLLPTTVNDESYTQSRYSLASYYSRKLSTATTLKAGIFASAIGYDLQQDSLSFATNAPLTTLDADGSAFLVQPWIQFRFRPNMKWTINAGLHSMLFTLNNSSSIEPRLGIAFTPTEKTTLSFAYGLHSRIVPIGSYFYQTSANERPNEDLDLIKSHHLVLAYDYKIGNNMRFHAEAYYQYLFDVPTSANPNSNYWTLNDIDGYAKEAVVSEGTGRNIGLDLSLEKAFDAGTFFILSGSIFNSQYRPLDQSEWLNTQYNSQYAATLLTGKEWQVGEGGTLQLGLKGIYNAGIRIAPLLSKTNGSTRIVPVDNTRPFEEKVPAYFRPDVRIAYRKDTPKSAWWVALDIQNVLNRQNTDGLEYVFNNESKEWTFRRQGGLTPVISFQIDF